MVDAVEYNNFLLEYFEKNEHPHQRLGQAFCNKYDISDGRLFYEENDKLSKIWIEEKYLNKDINPKMMEDKKIEIVEVEQTVFPSDYKSVATEVAEGDEYGGAHKYRFKNCNGFVNGKTEYFDTMQNIQFCKMGEDGVMIPGLQSEQLVIALLDRTKKLDARFPSAQNQKMMAGLEMFLEACKERVEERMDRGVMGELKK